jgi:hypothetical protein
MPKGLGVLQLKLEPKLSFNDPDIVPEYIMYPSPNGHGEVRGYLVRPDRTTKHILLIYINALK